MKARLIICAVTLAWTLCDISDIYACCNDPDASMTASDTVVCVGDSIEFDATDSSDPDCKTCSSCGGVSMEKGIRKFEWDWTNNGSYDHNETPGDGIASHTYSTAGNITCKLQVTDDDDDCCCDSCSDKTATDTVTVTVVEVTNVTASASSVCVDTDVNFTVTTNPAGNGSMVSWSGGGTPSSGTGTNFTTKWSSGGVKTVTATSGTSSDSENVTVIAVASVSEDKTEECAGEDITFTATANPSGEPLDCIEWQKKHRPDSGSSWGAWGTASGGDNTAALNTSTTGEYQYRARNGSGDTWKTSSVVTIVKVDKIQYDDPDSSWTDITGTLYVNKGTSVSFKAIPEPDSASWPSGKPVWGGTSGASGTGSTTSVTFNALSTSTSDYKTVTAEDCGTTVTVNVIVFEFEGVLTPVDDFDSRSTSQYGLEEQVNLTFTTNPTGISASQAGGLEWSKFSGVGTVTGAGTDGTATYDAGASDASVQLRLTIASGPSKDDYESYNKTVIAPSGTTMTRVNDKVWHIQGSASAGIALYYWLTPKTVSFTYLTFGEDSCPATGATGIYITAPPGNHAQNTFGAIGGGNSTTGCRVTADDHAWSIRNPWGNGGTYTWSIPTQYIDDSTTRHTFGSNQNHVPTLQANGDATMAKGGQSDDAKLNDPTSGYY